MASAAEVLRQVFIDLGLVVMPGGTQVDGDGSVVCFVGSMPDDYNQCVCCYDVAGMILARQMAGKSIVQPGAKIVFRSLTYAGYNTLQAMVNALDGYFPSVAGVLPPATINGVRYYLQAIHRTSPITALGEEVGKQRQLWSANVRMMFVDSQPNVG